MKRLSLIVMLSGLLLAGGLLTGCSDDDPTVPQKVVFASPDALVQGLVVYYSGMDYKGYAGILDQDFRFILQAQDINDCLLATGYLDIYQEQTMTSRMMAGLLGSTCGDIVIDPVESVAVILFDRNDEWKPVTDPASPFSGSSWAPHVVQIIFSHRGGSQSRVNGSVIVYARDAGLGADPDWKLTGLNQVSFKKRTTEVTWGTMRLIFRADS